MHGAGGRHEAAAGILAVDAELEGVSDRLRVGVVEATALGQAELLAHQVDSGHFLGHGMLDLQPGVDLQERDGAVLADQELAGAGAHVADLGEDRLGRAIHLVTLRVGQERRGGLLDQLLVAALQGTIAGGDDDDRTGCVGEALGLDVARLVQVLFDEAFAATERGNGLAGGGVEELGHLLAGAGDLEAATAAAEGRLDRDRQAVEVDEIEHLRGIRHRVEGAGRHRRMHLLGDVPCGDLVAELLDGVGGGADPNQAGPDHGAGEVGVLGEEPVAGVHGIGAGPSGHGEQLFDDEVGVGARGSVETVGLVGQMRMHRVAILVSVDGNRGNAAVFCGSDHPDGDFAPVCDEDLRYWGHSALAYGAERPGFWFSPTKRGRRKVRMPTNNLENQQSVSCRCGSTGSATRARDRSPAGAASAARARRRWTDPR